VCLQCAAVCCSVLQHSLLSLVSVFHGVAVYYNVLYIYIYIYIYIYTHIFFFSTVSKFSCFYCVAVCCSVYRCPLIPHHRQQIQLLSECCSVLQGVAVYCRMLQCLKWCTVAPFFHTTGSKFNCFQCNSPRDDGAFGGSGGGGKKFSKRHLPTGWRRHP